eukprot:6189782-Lingulodinium_polyedra.AAC.1
MLFNTAFATELKRLEVAPAGPDEHAVARRVLVRREQSGGAEGVRLIPPRSGSVCGSPSAA